MDQTYFYVLEKIRKQGLDHDTDAYSLEIIKPNHDIDVYIPLK
ncbi:hypothetical protein ACFO4N_09875 [Camelliibacillus cellulosilyticus]|uniref:GyrI-like small molecule binding protein n=1 Tax=Camelliibacillus cellulosilyticus TaxID=2174486 RepID=A0ABV9GL44_9BACL